METQARDTAHTTQGTKRDSETPVLRMATDAYRAVMCTVGAYAPETGGILLGPVDADDVTGFYFDSGANVSRATYSPDTATLKRKMKDEWLPANIDMKGFVHSHPGDMARLSAGDLVYIERLLAINPDMGVFLAPIVIPRRFRLQPIVVFQTAPRTPVRAHLELF